jgi:hypothetical protein
MRNRRRQRRGARNGQRSQSEAPQDQRDRSYPHANRR